MNAFIERYGFSSFRAMSELTPRTQQSCSTKMSLDLSPARGLGPRGTELYRDGKPNTKESKLFARSSMRMHVSSKFAVRRTGIRSTIASLRIIRRTVLAEAS
mmetsp:Transcript_73549/g.161093  ORF Transcript_73549/g.161093 Transcript_73549/m.161093 type:complete len:102 (+) Transcript_73549:413-718(+)